MNKDNLKFCEIILNYLVSMNVITSSEATRTLGILQKQVG